MRVLGGDYQLVLLLASGVVIWRPYFAPSFSIPLIRIALLVHSLAAVGLIIVIMVHIYAALWVKGTITAMVEGCAGGPPRNIIRAGTVRSARNDRKINPDEYPHRS